MIKASIYTILATCFLVITLQMVIGGFNHPGFNATLMVSIAGVMMFIMSITSLVLWKNAMSRTHSETPQRTKIGGIARYGKVFIASYGVAVGVSIFGIVAGMWLLDFEPIGNFIENYIGLALLAITIISAPIVNRYLS